MSRFLVDLNFFFFFNALQDTIPVYVPNRAQFFFFLRTSLMAQTVKNVPTMQKTQVQSLGREDTLEKEMASHFSILAWRIPWTKDPGRLQTRGLQSQTQLSN